jgi:hypothetical protein
MSKQNLAFSATVYFSQRVFFHYNYETNLNTIETNDLIKKVFINLTPRQGQTQC